MCQADYKLLERRSGFEPPTFSLEGRHSTTELPPQCGNYTIFWIIKKETAATLDERNVPQIRSVTVTKSGQSLSVARLVRS